MTGSGSLHFSPSETIRSKSMLYMVSCWASFVNSLCWIVTGQAMGFGPVGAAAPGAGVAVGTRNEPVRLNVLMRLGALKGFVFIARAGMHARDSSATAQKCKVKRRILEWRRSRFCTAHFVAAWRG
jgi:hypothetical protein